MQADEARIRELCETASGHRHAGRLVEAVELSRAATFGARSAGLRSLELRALAVQGVALDRLRLYREAVAALDRVLELEDVVIADRSTRVHFYMCHYARVHAAGEGGLPEQRAVRAYEELIEAARRIGDGGGLGPHFLSQYLAGQTRYDRAYTMAAQLLQERDIAPSTAESCGLLCHATTLVETMIGQGRALEARDAVYRLMRGRRDGYRQLLVAEGDALFALGDTAAAIRAWRRGQCFDGSVQWRLGVAWVEQRDYAAAIEAFQRSLRLGAESSLAWLLALGARELVIDESVGDDPELRARVDFMLDRIGEDELLAFSSSSPERTLCDSATLAAVRREREGRLGEARELYCIAAGTPARGEHEHTLARRRI